MSAQDARTAGPPRTAAQPALVQTGLPAARIALDGRLHEVNDEFALLVGRTGPDLLGRPLAELTTFATDVRRSRRALASAATGTTCGGFTQHWLRPGGTTRRVRLVWTLERDDQGVPAALNLFCVGDAVRNPGRRFWEALLTESADIAWTVDGSGVLTTVTSGAERQVGRSRAELVGTPLLDLAHPGDRVVLLDAWQRLLDGDRRQVVEYRLRHAVHGWRLVRQVLIDHRDDPEVGAVVANAVDVHHLRRVEAALGEMTQLSRAQLELSPVPQVQWDAAGVVIEANPAFCRLVGRDASALVGGPLRDLLHGAEADRSASLDQLQRPGSEQSEVVLTSADGRPVPTVASSTVLHDEDGLPLGVFAAVQDLRAVRSLAERRDRQEDFFLALAQRAADLALVTDPTGLVLYTSPRLTELLGWSAEDLLELPTTPLLHADDRDTTLAALGDALQRGGSAAATARVRDAHDRWRWVEATVSNLLDTAVGGILWSLRDIDARVRTETALRSAESRYRAIAEHAEEGLWIGDAAGRTAYANDRLLAILGLDAEAVRAWSVSELLQRGGTDVTPAEGPRRVEVGYRHPDGRRLTLRVSVTPLDSGDGTESLLAIVNDVTDVRELTAELRRAALHDPLTGLPNRSLLLDRLEHALVRETASTAVLFVDLDQFKHVNEVWGNDVADELLVRAAARLQAAARPTDTVARFAGDEFVVVCEDADDQVAHALAAELLGALDDPYEISGGREVWMTASIGVATSPASSAEELLRHADAAAHAAKAAGRHRVRDFETRLDQSDNHRLGPDLRRALERGELVLHHQPVVDLATGVVIGTEALSRWRHPVHGDVAPDRFVAVAEQLGLAPRLDRWALRKALEDATALRAVGAMGPHSQVAVNISAHTLGDPDLDRWIGDTVAAAGFRPADLMLEVTESAVMADAPTAMAVLSRLRERGFEIAVDDFGTGHSSLSYLQRLPVTVLKIDRAFVSHLTADASAVAIAASIVDLAHAVGLSVVAEGVETPEQAETLRGLGCGAAQGWLWSRAVSPDEARAGGALATVYPMAGATV